MFKAVSSKLDSVALEEAQLKFWKEKKSSRNLPIVVVTASRSSCTKARQPRTENQAFTT